MSQSDENVPMFVPPIFGGWHTQTEQQMLGKDEGDADEDEDAGDDAESDEDDDEQGSDDDDDDSGDDDKDDEKDFEGEFDSKRARKTIDRLRRELKAAKTTKATPKVNGQTAKVQAENLRMRVAIRTGLDEDLADRLRGSTEEELLEDAAKLLDRFYPDDKEDKKETRQPKPKPRGGSKPNEEPDLSAADLVKAATGR